MLKRSVLRLAAVAVAFSFLAVTAPTGEQAPSGKKLSIVTTLFPQFDFVRRIGGELVDVTLLLPAGSDPHAFDPRPSDLAAIAGADIFVYTGSEMEPWAEKTLAAVGRGGRPVAVNLSAGVELMRSDEWEGVEEGEEEHHDGEEEHEDEHHDGEDEHGHAGHSHILDPHLWLDPVHALAMAERVLAAMSAADPANAEAYSANAQTLFTDLRALDGEARALVAGSGRRVLVFGGRFAFAYFTHRYGLEHVGAYDSCGAGAEPSVRRIMEVTDYVKENAIPIVYHEEGVEPRISLGIAAATGCRTAVAHSLHNLSAAELASGVGFAELMRRNLAAFAEGLK